ncbi:ribonuclease E inhibitor RraB [Xinfangfangia sp. CPCC 101601]|uniref:Ribonuclease E inhibitor RraB n=1 Tax=Pseudogemmobacter lacusdianii TaxID=3069608 RepID=A0ABU0VT25_9RHOB|nr:ribonuclease E inhibitor RraB [Xinfangfangia sp. CPCC 101601]MDQ2064876.1 ribonuclease E inhibitor RraB [Xinfangfangia sp. CPCC 101601]
MKHNYSAQKKETYDTFRQSKGVKLPQRAVVDYAFFVEELDANWNGFEQALKAKGYKVKRLNDNETVIASYGPIEFNADEVWRWESRATEIALEFDFYPDGWEIDA